MPSALDLAKRETSQKIAAVHRRYKTTRLEQTIVRKGVIVATSAAYGAMNRMGVPVAIAGFPWKIGVEAGALLVEAMTKGNVQAVAGAIADSTLAIYTERSISEDTIIAGEVAGEDDPDDDPDDPADGGEI